MFFVVFLQCFLFFSVILSPAIIIGSIYWSSGYSNTYGGLRNHNIVKSVINRYSSYKCNSGTYKVITHFNNYNITQSCIINSDTCYSNEYLNDHYKLNSELNIYYDTKFAQECMTPDYAEYKSYFGCIMISIVLILIFPITCFISCKETLEILKDEKKFRMRNIITAPRNEILNEILDQKFKDLIIEQEHRSQIVTLESPDEILGFQSMILENQNEIIERQNTILKRPYIIINENECSICLENISSNQILLNCNHTFHKQCIDKWFLTNTNCPNCRTILNTV